MSDEQKLNAAPSRLAQGDVPGYDARAVLYIVTDSRRSYHRIIDRLEESAGAELIEMHPQGEADAVPVVTSKARIAQRLVSPGLLRLRGRWDGGDTVLIVSWYLLPVLALIRLEWLSRPRKLVAMGVFVQSPGVRSVVNALLRTIMIPELEVIAFSEGERKSLIDAVGVPPERVHKLVWGGAGFVDAEEVLHDGPPYIFSGGYANRDYGTLFAAVERLKYPVVVAASKRNRLPDPPANVELRRDLPEAEFFRLLAASHLLVVPLRAAGEASGQSVLLRGIQHRRPIVATRHDGLIDYLGPSYSGFVPAEDPAALGAAIERVMSDEGFRLILVEEVSIRWETLRRRRGDVGSQVLAMLQQ